MQEQIFDNKVLIEIIDLRDYSNGEIEEIYQGLSEHRKVKADAVRSDKNRALSILAGYKLEELLKQFLQCDNKEELIFSTNESGKPILIGESETPSFSISHSGNFAAVAVSVASGISVGIDIEDYESVNRNKKHMGNIAEKFFLENEKKYINDDEPVFNVEKNKTKINFFKIWTMKEAAMKALERPLLKVLRDTPYSPEDQKLFCRVSEDYVVSAYISYV